MKLLISTDAHTLFNIAKYGKQGRERRKITLHFLSDFINISEGDS